MPKALDQAKEPLVVLGSFRSGRRAGSSIAQKETFEQSAPGPAAASLEEVNDRALVHPHVRALFMTVWRLSTRSAENSCGIRQS